MLAAGLLRRRSRNQVGQVQALRTLLLLLGLRVDCDPRAKKRT
jgi:hypothetical protein